MPYINFVGDLLRLPSKLLSAIILAGMMLVVQEAYAQLTITKSVDKISVLSGELFTYTLQYSCANVTDPCNNVTLVDALPPEVRFSSLAGTIHTIGQTGVYDANTHTVTFTFVDPLPAGSTGDLTINCYFPNGITPDGETATNTGTITDGSTSVTSNPVTVTSHASDKFCPLLTATQQGAIGYPSQYQILVPVADRSYEAPIGSLMPQDMTVVQYLQPGTTFISAGNYARYPSYTGMPTVLQDAIPVSYDASANTITWTIPNSYIGLGSGGSAITGIDSPIPLYANVQYDNPPFSTGNISSYAEVTYTPLGTSTPITLTGDSGSSDPCAAGMERTFNLEDPVAEGLLGKVVAEGATSIVSGGNGSYAMHWENNGNVPLNDFTIEDIIPSGVQMTGINIASASGVDPNHVYRFFYTTELNPTYTEYTGATLLANNFVGINVYPASGNSLNLSFSDRLTAVRIEYGTVKPGFFLADSYWYFQVLETNTTVTETNCITFTTTTSPLTGSQSACASFQHLPRPPYATPYPSKDYNYQPSYSTTYVTGPIGSTIWARMAVRSPASQPIINPVVMDLLPLGLTYDGEWQMPSQFNGLSLPAPTFEHILNYNNSGRELLRWSWTATPTALDAITSIFVRLKTTNLATPGENIKNIYALSGDNVQGCTVANLFDQEIGLLPDIYDLDNDGSTTDSLCFAANSAGYIATNASAALESEKLVKGQCDVLYSKYPDFGRTMPGGIADYRLKVENVGNITMKDILIIDILPWVGDVGVLDPQTRLSQWRPNLAGPVTPPTGVTVYYSTESNPCRTELNYSPSGCTAPNWSLTPPNDITTVQSLKFDFGSITIAPGDSLILSWPMRAPVDAPTNDEITWNSFGYVGTRTDNNSQLLASEPIKVGIQLKPLIPAVYGNYVWLDTNQNGLQDDGQTGVSGVRVDLYKDNGDGLSNPSTDLWVGFTVTDATGQYVFPALTPGDYFAVFSPPTGYTTSPSNTGSDDAIDSDGIVTPVTHLDSGETDLTWDLGIYLSPNCDVQITSYTISPCNWDGSSSTVTVNVFVAWANAPSGENIAVTLNGNTETINVSGGATSPALVSFTMPANNTDYTINAAFNSTSSCSDIQEIHTPLPCNPNVCVLNIDAVNVSACNNGNSTLDVVLSWTGSPSAEDIIVTANGQTQTINVSGGILSPATVSFTVPADGSSNNPITAAFATTSTCSDNATYNAPTCALPCSVTVDSAVPSTCDPANNTYSLAVTVTYANPPIGDITINVGGTDYTFTPDGTSPDTYTVTGLTSNGTTAIDVSATFVGDNTCTHTLVDAYDAPVSCSGCVTSAIYLIDEDAADPLATHLWSFYNYNSPPTTGTDYGRLRYMHPTLGIQDITTTYVNDIEAMAVTPGGIAYILGTEKVSGGASHCQPLFMYDLNAATTNSGNIVMTLIGHILRGPTNVSYEGLLYDRITGRLYFADPVGSGQNLDTDVDILGYIDLALLNPDPLGQTTPIIVGSIQGLGEENDYVDGMEILPDGRMFTVDGTDDKLYEIDPNTGAIIAISDADLLGGTGSADTDIETIAWDEVAGKLIGSDNFGQQFVEITLNSDGSNTVLGDYGATSGINPAVDFESSAMWASCITTCVLDMNALPMPTCDIANNLHNVETIISFLNAPSSGDLVISIDGGTPIVVASAPFSTTINYTISGRISDGLTHTITASFTADNACSITREYLSPIACAVACSVTVDSAVPSTCDPAANTYSLDVTVTYANPPIGDITINVGGTDYTFTPDGTSPDTYTVTGLTSNGTIGIDVSATFVGDNTCTHTLVDAYDAPVSCECNLSAIADGTPVSCNGGSDGTASATPSGNTGAVTYLWSNNATTASINGLTAGTYTVTVTESATCTAIAIYDVTQPPLMDITCTKTDVTTNGGSDGTASVNATGGTSPYTYLWSSGETTSSISGKTSGTYTVTVTDDNGCTAICNSTIQEPGCNLLATATGTPVSCNGGSDGTASATPSGNTGSVTYLWSNNATTSSISGLTAGTYTVTVTESATCTAIAIYDVTQPPVMDITCTKTDVTTNGGSDGTASVNATGGTSPYTYLWNSGETTSSISGKTAGTYTVTVTDDNGCTAMCNSTINEPGALCNLTAAGLGNVMCNNNGTTADASDDYISFTLNPTGTTLGSSYVITVSSGSITPTTAGYGQTTTFQLQNGSAGSGNTITITITDDIDTNCKVQVDVPDTGSCSTPSCPPAKCIPITVTKQ